MGIFVGFLDLHSHVLPGVDDGATRLDESVELCAILSALGFEAVCATPHQKAAQFLPAREAIDGAFATVQQAIAGRPLALHLGAESFWDEVLLERLPSRAQPLYTGERAFLFELDPRVAPPRLEETLFQVRLQGLLPVMAHPERYLPLQDKTLERYQRLARSCALVVDAGALDGAHGAQACTVARRLVESGVAHAVASDLHTVADARAVAGGIAWIKKRLGEQALQRLLADHPRQILNGELPE